MIRLLSLALILLTMTLVIRALVRDQRRRRQETLVARLRSAFLHGAPLAPEVRVASLREHEWSGLRLSLPASWRADRGGAERPRFGIDPAGEVFLEIETLPPSEADVPEAASAPDATSVLLPTGAQLTKSLSLTRAREEERLAYEWCLRWPPDPPRQRDYRLRLTMPLGAASDILRESDVAAAERAAREARPINAACASPSAPA
jgi:hypothetical protein